MNSNVYTVNSRTAQCEVRREETVSNRSSANVYETCGVSCSGWMMQSPCCPSLSLSPRCRCWLLFEVPLWIWMSPSYLEALKLLCSGKMSVHPLTEGCLSMQGCSAERGKYCHSQLKCFEIEPRHSGQKWVAFRFN